MTMRYEIRHHYTEAVEGVVDAKDALGALNAYMDEQEFAPYAAPGTKPNLDEDGEGLCAAYWTHGTLGGTFTNYAIYAHPTIADGIGGLIDASCQIRGFGAGPDERDHFHVAEKVLGITLDVDALDAYAQELYDLQDYHDGEEFTCGTDIARWIVERLAQDGRLPDVLPDRIPAPAEIFPAAADQFKPRLAGDPGTIVEYDDGHVRVREDGPLATLRHHVTGAVERGEKEAITEVVAKARTILVHLKVIVPPEDDRAPDEIAEAILGAIEVGSDDDSVGYLRVTAPLAETSGFGASS